MIARRAHPALLTVLAAVTGCGQIAAPPPAPPPSLANEQLRQDLREEERELDLYGAWLVDSVDPVAPLPWRQEWPMILLAGVRQLEVTSQCITIGPFDYGRATSGGITVGVQSAEPRLDGQTPPPRVQCARGRSPAETAVPRILLAADRVRRGRDGAVTISGPQGSVTLRPPAGALANPRGWSPAPAVPPLIGAWRFTGVNGRTLPSEERMELLMRTYAFEWRSGCVSEARTFELDGNTLRPGEIDPFPVCERGRSEAERAVGQLFGSPVVVRMQADGRLTLTGSGVTAELVPLVQ